MALPKEVAGYVKRAEKHGAVVEGTRLRVNGRQISIPQTARFPDKLRNFREQLDDSGIWSEPEIVKVTLEELLAPPEEPAEPTEEIEWVESDEAAKIKGVSKSAVLDWARKNWVPVRREKLSSRGKLMVEFDRKALEAFQPPRRGGGVVAPAPVRVRHTDTAAGRLKEATAAAKAAMGRIRVGFDALDAALTIINNETDAALNEAADNKARLKRVESILGKAVDAL